MERNKFQKYEYVLILNCLIFLITFNAFCCIVECPWIQYIQIYSHVYVTMCHHIYIIQVQYQLLTETCHTCQAYPSWKMFSITYCGFLPSVFHVSSSTRSVSVSVVRRAAWPVLAMVRHWVTINAIDGHWGNWNILDLYQDRTDVEWVWWKHVYLEYCEFEILNSFWVDVILSSFSMALFSPLSGCFLRVEKTFTPTLPACHHSLLPGPYLPYNRLPVVFPDGPYHNSHVGFL